MKEVEEARAIGPLREVSSHHRVLSPCSLRAEEELGKSVLPLCSPSAAPLDSDFAGQPLHTNNVTTMRRAAAVGGAAAACAGR